MVATLGAVHRYPLPFTRADRARFVGTKRGINRLYINQTQQCAAAQYSSAAIDANWDLLNVPEELLPSYDADRGAVTPLVLDLFKNVQLQNEAAATSYPCSDIQDVVDRLLTLQRVLAIRQGTTIFFAHHNRWLLDTSPSFLANQMLALKTSLPAADISKLILCKPSILLVKDLGSQAATAKRKMQKMMPGIPFEERLKDGGPLLTSFFNLLQTSPCINL